MGGVCREIEYMRENKGIDKREGGKAGEKEGAGDRNSV